MSPRLLSSQMRMMRLLKLRETAATMAGTGMNVEFKDFQESFGNDAEPNSYFIILLQKWASWTDHRRRVANPVSDSGDVRKNDKETILGRYRTLARSTEEKCLKYHLDKQSFQVSYRGMWTSWSHLEYSMDSSMDSLGWTAWHVDI